MGLYVFTIPIILPLTGSGPQSNVTLSLPCICIFYTWRNYSLWYMIELVSLPVLNDGSCLPTSTFADFCQSLLLEYARWLEAIYHLFLLTIVFLLARGSLVRGLLLMLWLWRTLILLSISFKLSMEWMLCQMCWWSRYFVGVRFADWCCRWSLGLELICHKLKPECGCDWLDGWFIGIVILNGSV